MTRLSKRMEAAREVREEVREEYAFPELCESLRVSQLQVPGGQVVFAGGRRGDFYESDGYIYNGGKRSRRWCIDPRSNMTGQRRLMWPSRLADLAGIQRLSLRIHEMASAQWRAIVALLQKYKAAGMTAVTYRKEGTPPKEGSLQYTICSSRYSKGELSYTADRTPPIVSLVDAVVAHANLNEGTELHFAARRSSTLWRRLDRVNRMLDIAIRHRIGKPTEEKVYVFEICEVKHVYVAEDKNGGLYFDVKLVSAGAAVEKLVIE